MAQLIEVIAQKKMLDKKISELRCILLSEQNDDLAQELLAAVELRQGKLINIHMANIASMIKIGGTEMNIGVAVIIRDTIKLKIDSLTELIESSDCTLDKLELMKQRQKHFDEYTLIDMGIQKNDLSVTLG